MRVVHVLSSLNCLILIKIVVVVVVELWVNWIDPHAGCCEITIQRSWHMFFPYTCQIHVKFWDGSVIHVHHRDGADSSPELYTGWVCCWLSPYFEGFSPGSRRKTEKNVFNLCFSSFFHYFPEKVFLRALSPSSTKSKDPHGFLFKCYRICLFNYLFILAIYVL